MNREAKLFRRLRVRLTLVCTAATGVILVAMALTALAVSQSQLTAKSEAAFQREVNAALYYLRGQSVVDHTWLSQTEAEGGLTLHVELSGKPLLYGSGEEGRAESIALARKIALQDYGLDLSTQPDSRYQAQRQDFSFRDGNGQRHRAAAACLPQERGWTGLLAIQSLAAEEGELLALRLAFGGVVAVALGLLALFAWVFTRRALGPVEESRRRQTEFIAAASHELRAPLAVVRTSLSAIRGADADKAEHFTAMAEGECDRMSRLIGDMLSLANADSGAWSIRPAPVEPETLLLEAAERFERAAHEKGISLAATLPEKPLPRCQWDGERVLQLLTILVDNAISYTPAGGAVGLRAARAGEYLRLTVTDTGPGVPPEDWERIFERFYRGDAARTERTHYGLGLCVAQEIAALHRGRVSISDNPNGGAVFTVCLPIK